MIKEKKKDSFTCAFYWFWIEIVNSIYEKKEKKITFQSTDAHSEKSLMKNYPSVA